MTATDKKGGSSYFRRNRRNSSYLRKSVDLWGSLRYGVLCHQGIDPSVFGVVSLWITACAPTHIPASFPKKNSSISRRRFEVCFCLCWFRKTFLYEFNYAQCPGMTGFQWPISAFEVIISQRNPWRTSHEIPPGSSHNCQLCLYVIEYPQPPYSIRIACIMRLSALSYYMDSLSWCHFIFQVTWLFFSVLAGYL